ncbi:hypothetical protein [Nocardioides sp. YIM 152588]|uniref:hypothetical protein n=1 Tax=Nocardioides sp. YIM 152588 TaxID=3158259 RepID=UPI0032E46087
MSVMRVGTPEVPPTSAALRVRAAEPRVRERARDALTVMGFSAGVSIGLALLLLAGSWIGR